MNTVKITQICIKKFKNRLFKERKITPNKVYLPVKNSSFLRVENTKTGMFMTFDLLNHLKIVEGCNCLPEESEI